MSFWIGFVIAVPLLSAATIRFLVPQSEKIVSKIASVTKILILSGTLVILAGWVKGGFTPIEIKFGDLKIRDDFRFPLFFYVDSASITFLLVIAFISAVIIRYCRYYLHREGVYARFFMTIFLFISGMNLIVTSGTLALLFAGWEMVGISSFLLIAFYRERTLPVRNAFRAFWVYRICDLGLLLGIWLAHEFWRQDVRFSVLSTLSKPHAISVGYFPQLLFGILMLLAASGKSAQFPFCFWLPRAMEGPTPSSAIFYGALSIHAGVFLLIRTFPVWHGLISMRLIVATVGILSAFVSTLSGRAQSNIKGQLAYASITQVGIMLVELALGFRVLALLHVAANAFLKCYQLLVSPSVVAQILRIQGSSSMGVRISDWSLERRLPEKWRSSFYVFALNEGYLEAGLRLIISRPMNFLAGISQRIFSRSGWPIGVVSVLGILSIRLSGVHFFEDFAGAVIVFLMLAFSLVAIGERESPIRAWYAIGLSLFFAGVFPLFTGAANTGGLWVYFVGILPGWLLGTFCLFRLGQKTKNDFSLLQFRGMVVVNPGSSRWLFVSCLALGLFPVTPAFVGEDLLFHFCSGHFVWVAGFLALTFVTNGLCLIRLYSRLCLGPCRLVTDEMAEIPTLVSAIGIRWDQKLWGTATMPSEP